MVQRIRRIIVTALLAGVSGSFAPSLGPAVASDVTIGPPGRWAAWAKRAEPVFEGQYVASDPSIVRDGTLYRMFYTCFVLDPAAAFDEDAVRAALCQATSPDGLAWEEIPADGPIAGLVLTGREGEWDEHLEGPFVVTTNDGFLLYYSGYRNEGTVAKGYPAALAVARSTDGIRFERVDGGAPILRPTPGGYDNDAVYSEAIARDGDGFVMVYAGHCYSRCERGPGVRLLAATSEDGLTWTKRDDPVLEPIPDLPWTRDGVAEPALLRGTDGAWYLFFTGLYDEERAIGIARGADPFGPWDVNPVPIVVPTPGAFDRAGVLAPEVRIEGDVVRMWYLGATPEEDIAVGYAEAPWPLYRP